MHTRFILINTSHAGNVGAAARAMKTMGFDDLVLVAPRWANVLRREETIQRASGALDVLAERADDPAHGSWGQTDKDRRHEDAIGECALWNGQIFGLVAPGYDMARVVAKTLAGEAADFASAFGRGR